MSDTQEKLRDLENQMRLLIQIRNERRRNAELAVKRADAEFDRQALPLGRKINALRDKLEDEEMEKVPAVHREHRPQATGHPDPEWVDADQDHYRELLRQHGR